ncbi:MAG: DoxX family protein [Fimbriimonadaceae bacterium]
MDYALFLKALICLFFAVLFLQSGLDKVTDRKGNLEWLTGHFANSPLRGLVPILLFKITLLEIVSGLLCLIGIWAVAFKGPAWIAPTGLLLCCLSLCALFAGQRIAKDYAGAASLAGYFAVAVVGTWIVLSL